MDVAKKIGNNLKQARKDKKMTQSDVAKLLYMTQQQYSRFENGVFELNYSQIIILCDLFDISANDLFSMS
ncbi:MAG: helix-turn-helix transcriptional regulator [Clostridiales bacterium]|nr:helix-turn-helix transcriptional regulator [Clostridiales bacterium]